MKTDKLILDACCGGRMFWYDSKWNEDVLWDHYSDLPNPTAYL